METYSVRVRLKSGWKQTVMQLTEIDVHQLVDSFKRSGIEHEIQMMLFDGAEVDAPTALPTPVAAPASSEGDSEEEKGYYLKWVWDRRDDERPFHWTDREKNLVKDILTIFDVNFSIEDL